jgi:copper chaperone CopZ
MDILIFKTNLDNPVLVNRVQPVIQNIPGVQRWNVDIQDCDNVLRVEATEVSPRSIEAVLQDAGYYCEEMVD